MYPSTSPSTAKTAPATLYPESLRAVAPLLPVLVAAGGLVEADVKLEAGLVGAWVETAVPTLVPGMDDPTGAEDVEAELEAPEEEDATVDDREEEAVEEVEGAVDELLGVLLIDELPPELLDELPLELLSEPLSLILMLCQSPLMSEYT